MTGVRKYLIYIVIGLLCVPTSLQARSKILEDFDPVCDTLSSLMQERTGVSVQLSLKNIVCRETALDFYFTASLSEYPLRAEDCAWLRKTISELLPAGYRNLSVGQIFSNGEPMEDYVVTRVGASGSPPNVKYHVKNPQRKNIVTSVGGTVYGRGLSGRQIAIWPSHGRYYDRAAGEWRWQRPVLFQTVEDLFTPSFVLPYLVPMLENAGAYVMLPRERDVNPVEVIVDNDPVLSDRNLGSYNEAGKWAPLGEGFADTKDVYTGTDNPFTFGTARVTDCVTDASSKKYAKAVWRAAVPRGAYAVYVSYKTVSGSVTDAHYTVHHLGGISSFSVNQTMGGGTWIYLGTFEFSEELCRVELDNVSAGKGKVTADAVKLGGGMGNIALSAADDPSSVEECSGLPRYAEAAKYWLQWAGMPYEVYSRNKSENEYRDDIYARPDWVEYMSGGSEINPKVKGRGIPFDAVLAFHTDAGTFPNDSIIGTLAIYTRMNEWRKTYPDGSDRRSAREFADVVQTQIVSDICSAVEPEWQRRGTWNRSYIESRVAPAPSLLTESMSHQNFADMRYGLDPSFRFVLSRAVYKGVLKYLSGRYDCPYVVQPLPVQSFAIEPIGPSRVRLSWMPRADALEPTAEPSWYKLYTRIEDGAFDSGVRVEVRSYGSDGRVYCDLDVIPGTIFSYRVTAVNDGGESFPSEILAVGIPEGTSFSDKYVQVVNNFTRVSAPAWFDSPQFAGFDYGLDSGVPYVRDISFTGEMYCYDRSREWRTNEDSGFGASYSDWVGRPVAGNTFDFAYAHGRAVFAAGVPFASCGVEGFEASFASANGGSSGSGGSADGLGSGVGSATAIDLICGKQVTTIYGGVNGRQKYTVFPDELQDALSNYASAGGHILVSGSNIGTDIWDKIYQYDKDTLFVDRSLTFAKSVLGFRWSRNNASRTGEVQAVARGSDGAASGDGSGSGGSASSGAASRFLASGDGLSLSDARVLFAGAVENVRFNMDYNDQIYKVDAPDGLGPAGSGAATIFKYADSSSSAGVVYFAPDGHKVVSFGFPLETIISEEALNEIIAKTLKFFGL